MDKEERMRKIAEGVRDLEVSPLYDYRQDNNYKAVIGEGDLDAEIMFIGEAPGAQEAKSGRPFVGSAGRVLDDLLASIGIQRQDVYITNVVKDRPPENRDPHVDEIEIYTPFLMEQINIIQPKVIVTLGRFAMDYILEQFDMPEQGQKISDLHGEVLEAETPYGSIAVVPLYHPAAGFYNESLEAALEEDVQVLDQFVERS